MVGGRISAVAYPETTKAFFLKPPDPSVSNKIHLPQYTADIAGCASPPVEREFFGAVLPGKSRVCRTQNLFRFLDRGMFK